MIKERLVVYLEPEQSEQLKSVSADSGAPRGEIVRRALSEWLKEHAPVAKKKH
jgi:hypothetical protein